MRAVTFMLPVLLVACRGDHEPPRTPVTLEAPVHASRDERAELQPVTTSPDAAVPWAPPLDTVEVTNTDVQRVWLDRTEVTVAAYRECVDAAACSAPVTSDERPRHQRPEEPGEAYICRPSNMTWDLANHDAYPINCINFAEAFRYCLFRGGVLPTDREWRAAARGPSKKYRWYPWGDADGSCQRAVMKDRRGPGCGKGGPWPVGSKPRGASPFGALDMAGNVSEIVVTWENPKWLDVGGGFESRGGSYASEHVDIDDIGPSMPAPTVGFRCAYHAPHEGPWYPKWARPQ